MEDRLTVRQAAERLGVSKPALHQAIRLGHLPAQSDGFRLWIAAADVEAYDARTASVGPVGGRPRIERLETSKRPRGRPLKWHDSCNDYR